jgi:hypothetical protein
MSTGCRPNDAEVPCIHRLASKLEIRVMEECGFPLAERGRQLGVTTSAGSKAMDKSE